MCAAYSFLDVNASIVAPGGSFNFGSGAGVAEEGINIDFTKDKNVQTVGADGKVMNSLIASQAGTITVKLLKTSTVNAKFSQMYNIQKVSSAAWGLGVITVTNNTSGDSFSITNCAFKKHPSVVYDTDGRFNEWTFDGVIEGSLGGGILANLEAFGAGAV